MHRNTPRLVLPLLLVLGSVVIPGDNTLVWSYGLDDARFEDTAPASVALFKLAKQIQCPHTGVPMPCPNQTQPGPAFAMHIPKVRRRRRHHHHHPHQ